MFTGRFVICATLALGAVAHGPTEEADMPWWQKLKQQAKDAIASDEEPAVPVEEILKSYGGIKTEVCGTTEDAMQVEKVWFDPATRKVLVAGHLAHEITGGEVHAAIHLGAAPEGATVSEKLKRDMAWVAAGSHAAKEELCKHFGRSANDLLGCPLSAGHQELAFSFDRLPSTVIAGEYHVEVHVKDTEGKQVTCVRGNLNVARGRAGQMFRRLDGHMASGTVSVTASAVALVAVAMGLVA